MAHHEATLPKAQLSGLFVNEFAYSSHLLFTRVMTEVSAAICARLVCADLDTALGEVPPLKGSHSSLTANLMKLDVNGNYRAADKALVAAEHMAPVNSGFFRAMSLYRQGQVSEARHLFDSTVAHMPPLPDNDQNPLAYGASGGDMTVWLACREAAQTLGIAVPEQSPIAWADALRQEIADNPADTSKSLHLAVVLLWLGKSTEHEALSRQLLAAAADSNDPEVNDRAAKAYLLCSKPEPETLKLAMASAHQAFKMGSPEDKNMPWFRTCAGMAAFREGNFAEAETLLSEAIAQPLHEPQRRLALAFRAMAHSQAGRPADAQSDFAELAKLNLVLPERARMSAVVRDQDQLAVRLAYAEAAALLKGSSASNP